MKNLRSRTFENITSPSETYSIKDFIHNNIRYGFLEYLVFVQMGFLHALTQWHDFATLISDLNHILQLDCYFGFCRLPLVACRLCLFFIAPLSSSLSWVIAMWPDTQPSSREVSEGWAHSSELVRKVCSENGIVVSSSWSTSISAHIIRYSSARFVISYSSAIRIFPCLAFVSTFFFSVMFRSNLYLWFVVVFEPSKTNTKGGSSTFRIVPHTPCSMCPQLMRRLEALERRVAELEAICAAIRD